MSVGIYLCLGGAHVLSQAHPINFSQTTVCLRHSGDIWNGATSLVLTLAKPWRRPK